MGESSEIALTYAKIFLRELSPKNDFLDTATWARFSDFFMKFETWVLVKSFQKVIDFPVVGDVGFKDLAVGISFVKRKKRLNHPI